MAPKTSKYNYFVVIFAALGSLTYAFCNSVIGSVLGLPGFFSYFNIDPTSRYGSTITGSISGLFAGGGAIGALMLGWFANGLGRKKTIQMASIVCIIAAAIQAGSVYIAMFLVGRFISGISIGMLVCVVPVYQSEVSPPEIRGFMVGTTGGSIGLGYCLAAWTGFGCYFSSNESFQWRFELAAQIVAPLILVIGSIWLPESPRWLESKDRSEEAAKIVNRLFATKDSQEGFIAAREQILQIRQQIELERTVHVGRWDLFTKPSYRKRLFCGFFTQAIAQSTGVLVVNNFQVLLYNGLGLYGSIPLLLYACYLTNSTCWNWIGALVMDRTGRIPMMLTGLGGCVLILSCEAAMVAQFGGTDNRVGNGFGVLFLFLFGTVYGSCLDASTFVYSSEVFPTHLRAQGMGLSIFGQFAFTLLYTEVAPIAFASVGWKYYLVFIIVPVFGMFIIYKYFPETNGLSLEEIGKRFGEEVALDLSGLSQGERAQLDEKIMREQLEEQHVESI